MTTVEGGAHSVEILCEQFPAVPRSIVLKTDVLCEGIRYTPDLEEAGQSSIPSFLLWNPKHADNPRAVDRQMLMIPWKFSLDDGTAVKITLENDSPYAIRKTGNGDYVLCHGDDEMAPIHFDKMPQWYLSTTSDGQLLPTVIQLFSPACLLGCILRYCEYARADEQCRFCSLNSTIEDFQKRGFQYSIGANPDHWIEGFRKALAGGPVRHVSLTGGSLLDTHKEAQHYARIFSALSPIRRESAQPVIFEACLSALREEDQVALKDSGVDVVAHHMDMWEERLWPEIVPAKARHIGRDTWLAALERAVDIFGWGHVHSNFVIGLEVTCAKSSVPSLAAGIDSWRRCFDRLLSKGIVPRTTVWQAAEGSAYTGRPRPPAEYYLRVGYERYVLLKGAELHGRAAAYPCYECNCWSCDVDFMRLLGGCRCGQCAPPAEA